MNPWPLTVPEFEEWAIRKKKPAFDYMLTYSPYDNIEQKLIQHTCKNLFQ